MAVGSAAITGLSPKKRLSVVSERNTGANQWKPPSIDLLVTIALRLSPEATQMRYKLPSGLNETQGSELSERAWGPPWQADRPGMTTWRHRFPPSRLTAAPMPLKSPAIQAVTRFFG